MASRYFKIHCKMANGCFQDYGISMSPHVKNAQEAIAHLTEIVGFQDDVPVTRMHYRDESTGEYVSIVEAEPVTVEPFTMDPQTMRRVAAIASAPKPMKSE